MRKLSTLVAVLALSALVVPADAAWTDMSTSWNAQGVGSGWQLVADTDNDVLYAIGGVNIKKYNAGTDKWTALTASVNQGTTTGDNTTIVQYYNGKIYFRGHYRNYVEIYDIGEDTWAKSDMPTSSYTHSYAQGGSINPQDGKFWACWTDADDGGDGTGTNGLVYASMDLSTDTFGAAAVGAHPDDADYGDALKRVIIGTKSYGLNCNDQNVWMQSIDQTQTHLVGVVATNVSNQDLGASLGGSAAWGVQNMAADGTVIYITGADQSGVFWSFDTATDTWTDLEDFTNAPGGFRNHSMAVIEGTVYVQDEGQFLVYSIPEPATMALLGFGGLGLLARRRRRS